MRVKSSASSVFARLRAVRARSVQGLVTLVLVALPERAVAERRNHDHLPLLSVGPFISGVHSNLDAIAPGLGKVAHSAGLRYEGWVHRVRVTIYQDLSVNERRGPDTSVTQNHIQIMLGTPVLQFDRLILSVDAGGGSAGLLFESTDPQRPNGWIGTHFLAVGAVQELVFLPATTSRVSPALSFRMSYRQQVARDKTPSIPGDVDLSGVAASATFSLTLQ